MIGNTGETVRQGWMGDVPTENIDRYGNHKQFACLKQTKLNPKNAFNLFSGTKVMMNGWNLSGNDTDGIIITKEYLKSSLTFELTHERDTCGLVTSG